MKNKLVFGILLVVGLVGGANVVSASELPSKKSESTDVSPNHAVPSAPKCESVEVKSKRAEPLEWDQLDPKSLERSAKAQPKSPFKAVPTER